MTECLPDLPRYIRNTDAFGWQGADHPDGPWRSIPAPQSGLPWPTDGPAVPEGREPASVTPEATGQPRQLSPAAQAVLDAFRAVPDLRDCPSLAAALRAAADQVVPQGGPFLMTASEDRVRHQLLAIAAELEVSHD